MCGIVGSLNWHTPDSEILIQRMAATLAHRGPDAEKVKALDPVIFGHRRLSIIDISAESDQPMCDTTGRYWIVYNGELYNFKTLKAQLKTLGHTFKTESDTEVILEAWKRYDIGCLEKLVGMFAFALWDKEEKSLILARDRMGEKPLYYTIQASRTKAWEPASIDWRHGSTQQLYNLVFASELSALSQHPCVTFKVNPKALSQFLSLNYVLTDACILEGIEKLPPAHYLLLKKGQKPQIQCYWHLDQYFKQKTSHTHKINAATQLESLLNDSVKEQMISDVPLGAFLSGGIDSSTIVAAMQHAQSNPIKTFSIGFHEKSYNEIEESQTVAKHLSVDHHTQFIDADMVKMLPSIIQSTDEPLADSSIIPTYFLAQFSRQNVKVCLSGDGGDELFAGYETYTADKLHGYFQHLPKPLVRTTSSLVERFWPVSHNKVSLDYKLKQFLKGCQLNFQQAHYFWRMIFSDQEKVALLNQDCREAIINYNPYTSFAKAFAQVEECHPLDQAAYVDMKTWMVDDILVKVDRLSMAHSLEVRAPFLNQHLVEFAAALPIDWKMKFFQKKHILKLSQKTNLPFHILHRPKKGFNAPIASWFSDKLAVFARAFTLDNIYLKQWVNRSTLEQLWYEHQLQIKDNSLKLFGLLCLSLWYEHYQTLFTKRAKI